MSLNLEAPPLPLSRSRRVRGEDEGSDSEDSSLTPSLAEVSSDSLSWLDDRGPGEEDYLPFVPKVTLLSHKSHKQVTKQTNSDTGLLDLIKCNMDTL